MIRCDDQVLLDLLDDELSADESDITTSHIDRCPRCQNRLLELAADQESWHEATAALSDTPTTGSVVIALDSELDEEIPVQVDRVSYEFLEAPSHPEMLGRIGRYEIERLIGTGGMGIVFKAFDTELHRPVAIKVLAPHLAHSGGARQRFAREAQSAAAVVHENVVPIHNVDVQGQLPFLVMQYVAGESLQARVEREGPLSANEVLRIGIQIANGLAAAHDQGLVHRDVKPGNVLLETAIDRVLISDFGLARAADDASLTRSGIIAGTPHYMSPEQAVGESIDHRSDLFGLGGVLYFMFTGHPPFRAHGAMAVLNRICHTPHRPVDEVNDQVPECLAILIDELLAKKTKNRPSSMSVVASRLTAQLQSIRGGRIRSRRRLTSISIRRCLVVGASVLMLGLGAIGYFHLATARNLNQRARSLKTESPQDSVAETPSKTSFPQSSDRSETFPNWNPFADHQFNEASSALDVDIATFELQHDAQEISPSHIMVDDDGFLVEVETAIQYVKELEVTSNAEFYGRRIPQNRARTKSRIDD